MLILFVIFAERAGGAKGTISATTQSEQAMAVFAFFLFMIYGFFGMMLAVFRGDIIQDGKKWLLIHGSMNIVPYLHIFFFMFLFQ